MKRCLIGYTGFVGNNLQAQFSFDELYNSFNISEIKGKKFDLVICAAAPAAKWKANKNPEEDLKNINFLIDNLREIEAKRFVLISTVDVYNTPIEVDEATPIDFSVLHAYGKHRFYLEEFVRNNFNKINIIRLPGLFGKGLKKNAIYDLIHDNCLELIHCESVFQFYNLDRLYSDIEIVLENTLPLINFATEPISVKEIALIAFSKVFDNKTETSPTFYDMRSKYCKLFGSNSPYMLSKEEILEQVKIFVQNEKKG